MARAISVSLFILTNLLVQGNMHQMYLIKQIQELEQIEFKYIVMSQQHTDPTSISSTNLPAFNNRLSRLQKQLNSLCCQHDYLMPLLELTTFESVLFRWENNLKSINKKLLQFQVKVNEIVQKNERSWGSEYKNKLEACEKQRQNILAKVRQNVRETKKIMNEEIIDLQKSSQYLSKTQLIQQLYDSNKTSPLSQLEAHSQNCLNQLQQYIELCLALFKNQLLINQYSQSPMKQSQKQLSQILSQDHKQQIERGMQKLFRPINARIQFLRSTIKIQNLSDFHFKTMQRLSADILQISQALQLESYNRESNEKDQKEDLELRVRLIGWQIKGLKKKYLIQINEMFRKEQKREQGRWFEQLTRKDLEVLERAYKKLLSQLECVFE